jgi:hypothetical protein
MKLKTLRRLRKTLPLRILITGATLVVLGLVSAGYLYATTDRTPHVNRLVTFHDRGEEHVILTHASTVKDAVVDAGITLAPQDIVEPAIGSELLDTDSAVIIYRARPVLVVDGALRQKVTTSAQSPTEIVALAGGGELNSVDKATFSRGNFVTDGASTILTIKRTVVTPNTVPTLAAPKPNALTKSRGAQLYTDVDGVTHRETYYDLPMNIVITACGPGGYTIRGDGAKIDKDGYVLVAASYRAYPRCSIVDTSMGAGKVYDTGGFALRYPYGFDLATDWTNYDGR